MSENRIPLTVDTMPLSLAWGLAQDAFLDAKGARSAKTRKAYEEDLELFTCWLPCELWEVTRRTVEEFVEWMRDNGNAPATVNRRLSVLSSFYDYVQRTFRLPDASGREMSLWPLERRNPAKGIERMRIAPHSRMQVLSVEELQRLLGTISPVSVYGKRDLALIYTVATTCLRPSTVLRLRWGEIHSREDGDYTLRYQDYKGRPARAVLPFRAYYYICEYLSADERPPATMQRDSYLFVPTREWELPCGGRADRDRPIGRTTANRIVQKWARRAGLDPSIVTLGTVRNAGALLRAYLTAITLQLPLDLVAEYLDRERYLGREQDEW